MTQNSGQVKSILDPSFRYTPSSATDLRKTFAKIRRERRMEERAKARAVGAVLEEPAAVSRPDAGAEDESASKLYVVKNSVPWN